MTQDEIIRSPLGRDQIIDLAREASPDMTWYAATEDPTQVATEELEFLERFAALVAEPWIETNKALAKEIIELQKQAEQEPVAEVQVRPLQGNESTPKINVEWLVRPTPGFLYAAPGRTKDLTDDEIREMFNGYVAPETLLMFRAVIAADREKNK